MRDKRSGTGMGVRWVMVSMHKFYFALVYHSLL